MTGIYLDCVGIPRTYRETIYRFALFGVTFRNKQLPPGHMSVGTSGNL
jgi:hypothetical protein